MCAKKTLATQRALKQRQTISGDATDCPLDCASGYALVLGDMSPKLGDKKPRQPLPLDMEKKKKKKHT